MQGAVIREPRDLQDSINAADFLLSLSSAQDEGLCSGLRVNVQACERVLRLGQAAGLFPEQLHSRAARLQQPARLVA